MSKNELFAVKLLIPDQSHWSLVHTCNSQEPPQQGKLFLCNTITYVYTFL